MARGPGELEGHAAEVVEEQAEDWQDAVDILRDESGYNENDVEALQA